MAAYLRSVQLPPHSAISIVGKNSAYWIIADLAIWLAGYVSVPLYPTMSADTAQYIFGHCDLRLVFVGAVQVGRDAVLGEPGSGLAALRHGLAHATAALGAELVGGMEKAIEITVEYLKLCKRFRVPIGSFQALQHRLADMAAEMELARSMLHALLASFENDDAPTRRCAVSQAKAVIGRAARFVCAQATQLHGGIGMTEEYQVGHYYKRAVVADVLFGSSGAHDAACASQLQKDLLQKDDRV